MKKQTGHKFHVEQVLLERDWEIEAVDSPTAWHIDELWIIKSKRIKWGLKVQVEFTVDPHPGAHDRLDEVEIRKVGSELEEDVITTICLTKGHFHDTLSKSMDELDKFRQKIK